MKKGKRIIAAVVSLSLVTVLAVPAVFATESNTAQSEIPSQSTEQSTEEQLERKGKCHRGGHHAKHRKGDNVAEPENAIGADAAKEAALADAGVTADQVGKVKVKLFDKDGTVVYKVRFCFESQKYSYEIDPLTGTVLDKTVSEVCMNKEEIKHERPAKPEKPEEDEIPAEPELPEEPTEDEIPAEPELPEEPTEDEIPAEPELPEEPTEDEIPAKPELPEEPTEDEIPAKPELPEEPTEESTEDEKLVNPEKKEKAPNNDKSYIKLQYSGKKGNKK